MAKPVYEYQDFPERLSARGHHVEVIDFDEQARTPARTSRVTRTGIAEVLRSSIPHHNLPAIKYVEARRRYQGMLSDRLRKREVDLAFVYSVFINGANTVRLCRQHGIPVVYRVLDAYHRLRPGLVTRSLLRRGERYIYRNADRILLTNEAMGEYVNEVAGRDVGSRVEVLDHGVDVEHFRPRRPDPELVSRLGLTPEDRVALFLGTTYAFSGLDQLIERMPRMLKQIPALKLVVVGGGELDERLASRVSELGLAGVVHLTGMIPFADVPRYLSLAHLAINPFAINDITRDIVPIKILQYLAQGLPVLSTPLRDLAIKYPTDASGIVYTGADDYDDFANMLIHCMGDAQELARRGDLGRKFVSERHSVDASISRLEDVFTRVSGRKKNT